VVWISKSNRSELNNKKGPAKMPGLLRWDAFNQLERLEDETDQFGTSSKVFWKTTQEPGGYRKTAAAEMALCSRPQCYRFFFFPKMSFQLSL
jgi:hypothetical protein